MIKDKIPVEGHPNLVRDRNSGAIININKSSWQRFKDRRRQEKEKDQMIEELSKEVAELKEIVHSLIKKPVIKKRNS